MGEEDLRGALVGALNGAFDGAATAETYNSRGKSDILIRARSENILIAECKVYNGPAGITDAITQLLRYGTWRDKELALVVFVRTTSMSAAIAALERAVADSEHVVAVENVDGLGAELVLTAKRPGDEAHEVKIRVLLVNVPLPRGRRPRKAAEVVHPDDIIDALLEMKRDLPDDDGIEYEPTLDPAAPPPEAGFGWRVVHSRETPDGVAGIAASPVTERARKEHGPEGALIAPDLASARRLRSALRRTERDLVPTEMPGLGIRFDRIAGALRDAADRTEQASPEHITVVYKPRGLWQCDVHLKTDRGEVEVTMAFRIVDTEDGWDVSLSGTVFDFALTISRRRGVEDTALRWTLTADDSLANERLLALEFLDIYSGIGTINISSVDPPDLGSLSFDLEGFELDAGTLAELELFRNLAAVEDHAGAEIALADDTPDEWISLASTIGTSLRTGTAMMVMDQLVARVPSETEPPSVGSEDWYEFTHPISFQLDDLKVDFGIGRGRMRARVTEVQTDDDGRTVITLIPADEAARRVLVEDLTIPDPPS
jgi:hypothetical protein